MEGTLDNLDDSRRSRKIDRWLTLDVLHRERRKLARVDVGVTVEVKQPVFTDGTRGFPKINVTVNRDDRFIRFVCFDDDISEVLTLKSMLSRVSGEIDIFLQKYNGHIDDYRMQRNDNFDNPEPGPYESERRFEGRRVRRNGLDRKF